MAAPASSTAPATTTVTSNQTAGYCSTKSPTAPPLWLSKQTPEFTRYLDAYTAGINAYAAAHPDKLDPAGRRALPITTLDVIAHEQHFVNFEFVASQRMTEPPALPQKSGSRFRPNQP